MFVDKRGRTRIHLLAQSDENLCEILRILAESTHEQVVCLDKSGESPLHVAARSGSLLCLRALIEANCELDIQSKGKLDTPLILASCHGHIECVEFLLQAGADWKLQTRQGFNAQQWAKRCGHINIFDFFSDIEQDLPD